MMIGLLARSGRRLDAWLHQHFGRPYNIVLGIGLSLSILDSIRILSRDIDSGSTGGTVKTSFSVLFQGLLLINQLAQLDERREKRRARKAEEKAQKPKAVADNI